MRAAARLAAAATMVGLTALPVSAATGSPRPLPRATVARIPLPAPIRDVDPLQSLTTGIRKDRLLPSVVPGSVDNREQVTVSVGPAGSPAVVTDEQRLVITGAGNYIVRELGPARAAVGLGDTNPPVLELGQVVWQGFSPGNRTLSALLTLDPGIEARRLPMSVALMFRDARGKVRRLSPGATAPADGAVTVTLVNQSPSPRVVPVGTGATAAVAAALDRLLLAAEHPRAAVPPYAGDGLPTSVPGVLTGQALPTAVAPLRVTGTVGVAGAVGDMVSGPGTTPAVGGAAVAGTLSDRVSFVVRMRAGQRLALDLHVRPWLDPRALAPPAPAHTWREWAAASPSRSAVTDATATLVQGALATARSAEYSPYLQAGTPGPDLSSFRYVVAAETATQRAGDVLHAKPGAILATVLAALAIAGNAALLHHRL